MNTRAKKLAIGNAVRLAAHALIVVAPGAVLCQAQSVPTYRITPINGLTGNAPPDSYHDFTINDNEQVFGKQGRWQNGVVTSPAAFSGNVPSVYGGNANGDMAVELFYPSSVTFMAGIYKQQGGYAAQNFPAGTSIQSSFPTFLSDTGELLSTGSINQYGGTADAGLYSSVVNGSNRPSILQAGASCNPLSIAGNYILGGQGTSIDTWIATVWNKTTMQGLQYSNFGAGSAFVAGSPTVWAGYSSYGAIAEVNSTASVNLGSGVATAVSSGTTYSTGTGFQNGVVMGNSVVSNDYATSTAFVVYGNSRYNLNTLQQTSATPWTLQSVSGVNSHGQAVGYGLLQGVRQPYLATPVSTAGSSGSWDSSSTWGFGFRPSTVNPVSITNMTSGTTISVTGSSNSVVVPELNVGVGGTGSASLGIAAGTTLTVSAPAGSVGTGQTSVGPNGQLSVAGTLASPLTVAGLVYGTGTLSGTTNVSSGGGLLPGSVSTSFTPGTLTAADIKMNPGSVLDLLVADNANGSTASTTNSLLVGQTGAVLDLSGVTPSNPIYLQLISLTPGGQIGQTQALLQPSAQSWNVADFSRIAGYQPGDVVVATSLFSGGTGHAISLTVTAQNIVVNYSATATVVSSGQTYHFTPSNSAGIDVVQVTGGLTINSNGVAVVDVATDHTRRQLLVIGGNGLSINGSAANWTGRLDIGNNDLDLPGASLQTVTDQVREGYAFTAGATWAGNGGITSSSAATDPNHLTAVGVVQNNQSGTPLFSSGNPFDTYSVGASDILVKFTYFGDANLDGRVDGSDYSLIDSGYLSNGGLTGWYNGDFNYDGVVDGSDYALIDNTFNQQGSSLAAAVAATTAEPASVPEPDCLISLVTAFSVCAVLRVRRI